MFPPIALSLLIHLKNITRRYEVLLHSGGHRIRHYGLLASARRKANVIKIRALLGEKMAAPDDAPTTEVIPLTLREPCPDCGGPMRIIEIFRRGRRPSPRAPPRKQAA